MSLRVIRGTRLPRAPVGYRWVPKPTPTLDAVRVGTLYAIGLLVAGAVLRDHVRKERAARDIAIPEQTPPPPPGVY